MTKERSLGDVPRTVLVVLAVALVSQIAWQASRPLAARKAEGLPPAPSHAALRASSFGEVTALAKALMLYLQAFDVQPGISVPLRNLNYTHVQDWLGRVLDLDPAGQYPLMAASRLYAEAAKGDKRRQMLEFVHQRFLEDPDRRWPWLAHAALIAKHREKDLPMARRYARSIREQAKGPGVPLWARQLEIFILEDMNELEAAKYLIGGLLDSGQITDPNEMNFLEQRMGELEKSSATPPKPVL